MEFVNVSVSQLINTKSLISSSIRQLVSYSINELDKEINWSVVNSSLSQFINHRLTQLVILFVKISQLVSYSIFI